MNLVNLVRVHSHWYVYLYLCKYGLFVWVKLVRVERIWSLIQA